ncbi:MAG: hypothetical protein G01um101430_749 [Parcubacteria group bacterium Gr01-1014_30]|nr:MAG: hypothetical protein G01um101430_749 [Parcubacteria group bacterium Gr01-1014_30]
MSQTTIKNSSITLRPQEVRKIFDLSLHLSDITEDLLEENAYYSEDFLRGLKQAEKDLKEGRVKKLKSLRELR